MTWVRPFVLLVGRAATFWLGLLVLACVSILLAGLSNPEAPTWIWVETTFLAALAYPATWGFLSGLLIQELQHASFTWPLPGARSRLLAGLAATGLPVVLFTSLLVALHGTPVPTPVLLALGLAGLGLGSVAIDPLSGWRTALTLGLLVAIVARSRLLAGLAAEHSVAAVAICGLVAGLCLHRLLGIATFRSKPFMPTAPVPGMYSFDRTLANERRKLARDPSSLGRWRSGYLGTGVWSWVRASLHASMGSLGWRRIAKIATGTWPLWMLLAAHAWTDRGDLGFPRALALTLYQEILGPPGVPHLGDEGHQVLVTLFVAASGAALAFWLPVAVRSSLLYPLSRRSLARVGQRTGWLRSVLFVAAVGGGLSLVGLAAGRVAGYPSRMDYVPFIVWPLLSTAALMPAAEWATLRVLGRAGPRPESAVMAYTAGLVVFVALAAAWTFFAPRIPGGPGVSLPVTLVLILGSHLAFADQLARHFAKADLV